MSKYWMGRIASFSSDNDDNTPWRDAAIGGLEGALGYTVTEPLVNRFVPGMQHSPIPVEEGMPSGGGWKGKLAKLGIAAATGAAGTALVGAGVNAVSKPQEQQSQLQNTYRRGNKNNAE